MSKLTPKERQVVEAIRNNPGLTVNGVSQRTGLTRYAAKFHLYNVYGKLQVNSRPELIEKLCKDNK